MKILRLSKFWIGFLIISAGIFSAGNAFGAAPSPSSFKPDMPFEQAINILRNSASPHLNIAVLWKDLERNAGISKNTPIGIDGVSKVPLRTHLKLLLSALSAGSEAKLGYVIDEGVIIIATEKSLPGRLQTRIYYIADLVAR